MYYLKTEIDNYYEYGIMCAEVFRMNLKECVKSILHGDKYDLDLSYKKAYSYIKDVLEAFGLKISDLPRKKGDKIIIGTEMKKIIEDILSYESKRQTGHKKIITSIQKPNKTTQEVCEAVKNILHDNCSGKDLDELESKYHKKIKEIKETIGMDISKQQTFQHSFDRFLECICFDVLPYKHIEDIFETIMLEFRYYVSHNEKYRLTEGEKALITLIKVINYLDRYLKTVKKENNDIMIAECINSL